MLKLMENETNEAHQENTDAHGYSKGGIVGNDPDATLLISLMNPTLSQKCNSCFLFYLPRL
jgi:hypothetical protein